MAEKLPLYQRLGCHECTKACRFNGSQTSVEPPTDKHKQVLCNDSDKYGCNKSKGRF
jgi:hypothetical protein